MPADLLKAIDQFGPFGLVEPPGKPTPDPGIRGVTRADLRPYVNGTAEEVGDAAHELVESVMPDPLRGVEVDVFRVAFDDGLAGDYEATRSTDPAVARRGLLQLAARCVALLALDEVVRGSDAVEAELFG